jgi:hypothetical protein
LSDGKQKLVTDLTILEAMAAGMNDYLMSKTLWQTIQIGMPQLTLGGYLMRQHRLLALSDVLLNESERARLKEAVSQFDQALRGKETYFEQKAQRELDARLRQWSEYLRELEGEDAEGAAYYPSSVETRAMIAALIDKLQTDPYRLESDILSKIDLLDARLRQRWTGGEFVWPSEWQPAYPRDRYWWLYGRPMQ